jgi:hypothetical protein
MASKRTSPVKPKKVTTEVSPDSSMIIFHDPITKVKPLTPAQEATLRQKQAIRKFPTTSI